MLIWFIVSAWIVSGHFLYIEMMTSMSRDIPIKEFYSVEGFIFVSIAGPLILIFKEDD